MYDAATRMLGQERDELKIASAFITTAHILLLTADETERGLNAFRDLLQSELDLMSKVKTKTDMQARTRAIEKT